MKIMYSKATVGMMKMQADTEKPIFYDNLTIEGGGISLQIENFSGIGKAFGITIHKLLCAGLIEFTKQNHISDDRDNIQNEIAIPLRRYVLFCGHDNIVPKDETDQKRAEGALIEVRRRISKDLKLLLQSSLKLEERSL